MLPNPDQVLTPLSASLMWAMFGQEWREHPERFTDHVADVTRYTEAVEAAIRAPLEARIVYLERLLADAKTLVPFVVDPVRAGAKWHADVAAALAGVPKEAARLPDSSRGDGPCADCGTLDNIVWFTESPLWNQVCRPEGYTHDPILCVTCFVARAEKVIETTGWALVPENAWYARRYVTDDSERATVDAIAAEADANDLSTEEVITRALRIGARHQPAVVAAPVEDAPGIPVYTDDDHFYARLHIGYYGDWQNPHEVTFRVEAPEAMPLVQQWLARWAEQHGYVVAEPTEEATHG